MTSSFKRSFLSWFGLPKQPPVDRERQRIYAFDRAQLFRVLSNSGQTPPGASWASTNALRHVALRLYDGGRIKPHYIKEIA